MSSYKLSLIKTKVFSKPDKNKIADILQNDYEKTITPLGSYIIRVLDHIKEPMVTINDINGNLCYKVYYTAMIFYPMIGQTIDVYVTKVKDNVGAWSEPVLLRELLGTDYNNNTNTQSNNTSSAKSSGCQVYCITSADDIKFKIKPNTVYKFKIMNKQIEFNKIMIYGLFEK
jgi:DNA-directed RNA polymerase subunit E'/Rpb7